MQRRQILATLGLAAAATAAASSATCAAGPLRARRVTHGFHARMKAKPGMGDAVVALLFAAPSFELEECPVFIVGRSKDDSDVVFVTEGWTSEQAHTRFTQTGVAKAYTAKFAGLVEEWTMSDEIVLGGKALFR